MVTPTTPEEAEAATPTTIDQQPDPEEFKPGPSELVVSDRTDPQEVYKVLDRHDEEQILEELQGRMLGVWVYSFEQHGRMLTDLSYAGVQEVVRTLNARRATAIRVASDPRPEFVEVTDDGETFIQCTAYAEDTLNGGGAWGTATEPKYMKLRNGKTKLDSFARTKALSKAQRNAEKALIPEGFRQMLLAMFLKDETKVKQIQAGAGAEAMADLPAPLTDEEAEQKREECRRIYTEIRALKPLEIIPGQFNAMLMRHEWSHERLDELIAHLNGVLERVQSEGEEAA